MAKCSKAEVRRLRTALCWKIPAVQRQRIQMVLLRESGMAQPAIAAAMGVSLSTVNRAHMAYDHGGIKALKPKPNGGRKHENMTLAEENALLARFAKALTHRSRSLSMNVPTACTYPMTKWRVSCFLTATRTLLPSPEILMQKLQPCYANARAEIGQKFSAHPSFR